MLYKEDIPHLCRYKPLSLNLGVQVGTWATYQAFLTRRTCTTTSVRGPREYELRLKGLPGLLTYTAGDAITETSNPRLKTNTVRSSSLYKFTRESESKITLTDLYEYNLYISICRPLVRAASILSCSARTLVPMVSM